MLRKHEEDLRRFRRDLFSTEPTGGGLASVLPPAELEKLHAVGRTVPHHFGPVRSVADRHAVLTIMGDISDQAMLLERPGREGSVLTLSVAAKNKQLRTRMTVDPQEARAWVEAIVGPTWLPHVYSAGALSGFARGGSATQRPLTTRYYHLFLGTDGLAHAEPEHELGVTLTPLADVP